MILYVVSNDQICNFLNKARDHHQLLSRQKIIEDRKEYLEKLNTEREEEEGRRQEELIRQQLLAEQRRLEAKRQEQAERLRQEAGRRQVQAKQGISKRRWLSLAKLQLAKK